MKQFFKYMFASTLGTIIGFFFVIMISTLILIGVISSAVMMSEGSGGQKEVKANSVLVVDLSQEMVERRKPSPFDDFQFEGMSGDKKMELAQFIESIENAKTDDNIKGIYIKGNVFNGSFATLEAVRNALISFKESGKFVIAYEELYTQGAYYAATAADEVYLFKEGMLELYGLRTEIAFFKGMFDKLGIEATVVKGPDNIYKSAVEPFTRTDMSEPSKLQIQRIIDVLWDGMVQNIATARKIQTADIERYADELTVRKPEDLVELGLVDGVVYYDDILVKLREKLGIEADAEIEMLDIADYPTGKSKDKDEDKSWELNEQIAVIYAVGGIESGEGDEETIGSETVAEAIREARLDEDVKAIVMRVNSPGGSALASEVIWREVVLAKAAKPFIVSFGDVAASGGYYISTHADRIFASPSTITGSIGVFGLIPDVRGFLNDKLGVTFDGVKTNEHSDFGSLKRGFDEAEMALLNDYVGQTYTEFVEKVAEGRNLSVQMVDSIARGRVWLGTDAKEIGLVDEFGDLSDALAYAAEKAGLEKYDLLELPEKKDPIEEFFKELGSDARMTVAGWVLTGDEAELLKKMEHVKNMEGIQARMMFDIKVN